jgi:hypothetical protein
MTASRANHLPAALAYGKAGLFIFPILEGTKDQPLIKQWGIRASCDAAQITEWWTRWPQANIGLACMMSGIAVIDSDVPDGETMLQYLADFEGKILSPTKMARSPRGGIHRFYRGRIATTAGKIGKNVDTRGVGSGNGGYVLLAPSRTKDGSYKWIEKAPMAEIDPWIVKACGDAPMIGDNSQVPAVEQDTPDLIAHAIYYLKNDAKPSIQFQNGEYRLLMTAAMLKDIGISQETAIELLAEYYNIPGKCEPLWEIGDGPTADRLDVKVVNAWRYLNQTQPGSRTAQVAFGDEPVDSVALDAMVAWWKEFDKRNSKKARAARAKGKADAKLLADGQAFVRALKKVPR